MCWSSSDSKCSHLRLQALCQTIFKVFALSSMSLGLNHLSEIFSFILKSYSFLWDFALLCSCFFIFHCMSVCFSLVSVYPSASLLPLQALPGTSLKKSPLSSISLSYFRELCQPANFQNACHQTLDLLFQKLKSCCWGSLNRTQAQVWSHKKEPHNYNAYIVSLDYNFRYQIILLSLPFLRLLFSAFNRQWKK